MIDLHYWTTPNGHKITMFLEETGLPYNIVPVNRSRTTNSSPNFSKSRPTIRLRRSWIMIRSVEALQSAYSNSVRSCTTWPTRRASSCPQQTARKSGMAGWRYLFDRRHRRLRLVAPYNLFGINVDEYPALERWLEAIASRPATERAYAIAKDMNPNAPQLVRRAVRKAAKEAA
jgi:hypothetical protein